MTDEKKTAALLPCPFCGGDVMPRDALWPSDGDSDQVIHTKPTDCPLQQFFDGSFDKSLYARWNDRAKAEGAPPAANDLINALKAVDAFLPEWIEINGDRIVGGDLYDLRNAIARALTAARAEGERATITILQRYER